MKISFHKYHALGNDFIVLDHNTRGITSKRLPALAAEICDRRSGVGADGIIAISASRRADYKIDIYNADGGWAEKSGNGSRIAALCLVEHADTGKSMSLETGSSIDRVKLIRKIPRGYLIRTELGEPEFEASRVPVKSKQPFVINSPIPIDSAEIPMTCLAVGNPHAVLVVDNFDFDWRELGAEIEKAKAFPNGTNVEFVKPVNRKKLRVCDWERGAGATGSSGTGAAAAVCAMVMLGLADRKCTVQFETGGLEIEWSETTNLVELTGPVEFVVSGEYEFK